MRVAKNQDGSIIYAPARPSIVLFAFLGAVIGAAFIAFLATGRIVANGITYADLAAILLSAVGVMVAILGGVLAIAALWGFQQMKREAIKVATDAAVAEVREQIENGDIRRYILEGVEEQIKQVIASPDFERRVNNRVDQIAIGNPADRLLEQDDNGEEL